LILTGSFPTEQPAPPRDPEPDRAARRGAVEDLPELADPVHGGAVDGEQPIVRSQDLRRRCRLLDALDDDGRKRDVHLVAEAAEYERLGDLL
jgi:hypothetical protein